MSIWHGGFCLVQKNAAGDVPWGNREDRRRAQGLRPPEPGGMRFLPWAPADLGGLRSPPRLPSERSYEARNGGRDGGREESDLADCLSDLVGEDQPRGSLD